MSFLQFFLFLLLASSVQTQPATSIVQKVNFPSLPLGQITGMNPWNTPGGTAAAARLISVGSGTLRAAGLPASILSPGCQFLPTC